MEPFHITVLALVALALCAPSLARLAQRLGIAVAEPPVTEKPRPRWRSLADAMGPVDNLLLLRLIAAAVVLFAHSYALAPPTGEHDPLTRLFGIYSGTVAVYVFFFVSGFVVTGSWLRLRSLGAFLLARATRVVPAYAACLALCALLLGPLVSTLAPADYFAHPQVWRYIGWNVLFPESSMQFALPGVFESQPRNAVNGSLWTLPAEARAYVLLAVFGLLGLIDRLPRLLLALAIAFVLVSQWGYRIPLVAVPDVQELLGYFALGMLAWRARGWLPFNGWIAVALLVLAVLCRGRPFYPYAFALALCYLALRFAYTLPQLHGFNRLGDYSYGLYLWAFPMQQLVVFALQPSTPTQVTLLAFPLARGCAVVSWHGLEKPALAVLRRRQARLGTKAGIVGGRPADAGIGVLIRRRLPQPESHPPPVSP